MRLGAFSVVDALPPAAAAGRDRYAEVIDLAAQVEAAGLDSFWIAEHHFHEGGLCPSPPILLAAIGQRARHIALGVMVSVLPFHDPVELAEQYALLDQLIGGRLRLGVGSGYIPAELAGFGLDAATKRARFDAHYATLLEAFRGEPVRPARGDGAPVVLNVRPVQRPHPPIWIATQRREALAPLARRGASIALIPYATVSSVEELAGEIREYRAALPVGTPGRVAAAVHLYGGPDRPRAMAALQTYLDGRRRTGSPNYEAKVAREPSAVTAEAIAGSGLALLGPPDTLRPGLERFARAGVDDLLGILDFGGLTPSEISGSIEGLRALRWGSPTS